MRCVLESRFIWTFRLIREMVQFCLFLMQIHLTTTYTHSTDPSIDTTAQSAPHITHIGFPHPTIRQRMVLHIQSPRSSVLELQQLQAVLRQRHPRV